MIFKFHPHRNEFQRGNNLYPPQEHISRRQGFHADGSFAADGAVVFTCAAADAQLPQHIGTLNCDSLSPGILYFHFFQANGFLRQRADLFTYTTDGVVAPHQAAGRIDACQSDGRALLFFQG